MTAAIGQILRLERSGTRAIESIAQHVAPPGTALGRLDTALGVGCDPMSADWPAEVRRCGVGYGSTRIIMPLRPLARVCGAARPRSHPAAKERFEGGLAFAKGNRLDRACEIWNEISSQETGSPLLFYNRGVCAEVSGRLDTALALYTSADRLLTKPDTTISDGLDRVRKTLAAGSQAQSQLGR